MDNKIFQKLNYGMYCITTDINNKKVGCIVNTVTQITSENPIISVSINKNNYTNSAIKGNGRFAVSVLSEKTDTKVISKFGFYSSENIEKFQEISHDIIDDIPVVIDHICGYMICEVIKVVECETHDVFFARVINTVANDDFIPMSYKYYHEVVKGKAPKNAPTYIKEEKSDMVEINVEGKKVYVCSICGYVYDEAKENVEFKELPESWKWPICGVEKNMFELKHNI